MRGSWLRIGFWVCFVIAIAAAARRAVALSRPARDGLDAAFASHAGLTLAHVLAAATFVAATPFVVFGRRPWAERLLFPIGIAVGATAFAMSRFAVGGWIERSAVLVFNSLFLVCLARGQFGAERRLWLLRAIATLLGIATTRPVMAVFFATRGLTRLEPAQFFGLAFWMGFSINTAVAWLSLRRRDVNGSGNG